MPLSASQVTKLHTNKTPVFGRRHPDERIYICCIGTLKPGDRPQVHFFIANKGWRLALGEHDEGTFADRVEATKYLEAARAATTDLELTR